jgi:tRNA pseudouridine38-40 synthase
LLRELQAPVGVLKTEIVDNDFHARFSAKGRGYIYRILNRRGPSPLLVNRVWLVTYPLDVEAMKKGAQYLIGHHDFSSFRGSGCQALSPLKTLDKLDIQKVGDEIIFTVEARSFIYHQVRNMVGTLMQVGNGKFQPEDVKTILEACDRKKAGISAPAYGLYLNKVIY